MDSILIHIEPYNFLEILNSQNIHKKYLLYKKYPKFLLTTNYKTFLLPM